MSDYDRWKTREPDIYNWQDPKDEKLAHADELISRLKDEWYELRGALVALLDIVEFLDDEGPAGQGWQSEEFIAARQRADAILAKTKGEARG